MIRSLAVAALASLLLPSCVVAIGAEEDFMHEFSHDATVDAVDEPAPSEAPAPAQEQPKKPEEVDLDELEWAVVQATVALEKGELSGQISLAEAEQRVARAKVELSDAHAELEHFDAYTAPTDLAQRRLSLDRSESRLLEAEAELQQLVDMYAAEEFATSSKELVLERGKRNVDFQQRTLAMAKQALEDLETFDLARRRAKLERAVEQADLDVMLADRRLVVARLGVEHDRSSAARKLAKAEQALAEARAKVEAGEAVVKE